VFGTVLGLEVYVFLVLCGDAAGFNVDISFGAVPVYYLYVIILGLRY
jgi:hypothetical protein